MSGDYEVCNVQRDIDAVPGWGSTGARGGAAHAAKVNSLVGAQAGHLCNQYMQVVHAHHHNPIATLARSLGRIHVSIARAT